MGSILLVRGRIGRRLYRVRSFVVLGEGKEDRMMAKRLLESGIRYTDRIC